MGRRLPAILIGLLSMLANASGQTPAPPDDPIARQLDEAKKTYRMEVEKSREIVIKAFVDEDEKARDAADVDLVKALKAERATFEATGQMPKHLPIPAEYTRQREKSRKGLYDAYTAAIRAYLKARDDDKAEKIKDERDRFEKDRVVGDAARPEAGSVDDFGVTRAGSDFDEVQGVKIRVGDPQFTLIWDSTADIDLHVIEPGGKEIFWNDRKGNQGGELDIDNCEGYGPENISWFKQDPDGSKHLGPSPPGEYRWFVSYYGGNRGVPVSTKWKVRVKHAARTEVFQGTLTVPGAKSKVYTLQVK
jgi:hypothetical protein